MICSQLAPAPSPNVTGTWTWTYEGGDTGTPVTHTYTFKQTGETLTGTFQDTFDETTAEISNGKIHDGNVSFTVDRPFMDSTISFTFTGEIIGKVTARNL